jgi:ABC-type multidrug transport system ATPase subunit/ABC-type multidrug transport system permease subunit
MIALIKEFYWLSPFSWAIRSIAINEFSSSVYDDIDPTTGLRKGDSYMKSFGLDNESGYQWAGVGYMIGIILLLTVVGSYWLKYVRFDLLQGTKRNKAVQEVREEEAAAALPHNTIQVQSNTAAAHLGNLDQYVTKSSLGNINSVLPFQPASLAFSNISYTIQVKNNDPTNKGPKVYSKQLLTNVNGYVKPGQLVALMGKKSAAGISFIQLCLSPSVLMVLCFCVCSLCLGSSGAGKTTLMDVISGRKTEGEIQGEIRVNGQLKSENSEMFKRISGYCEQSDLHMPLATVRESLLFSASLRLPRTVSEQQRKEFVDELLDILELNHLADRIVGNEKYAGLSPGQLKLLTIGVELAANPSILFLDEPTSGLDSRAAVLVMRCVKRIANTGRAVLCTIHQPSFDVFSLFDTMLLLRSGGFTVFFGSIGDEAVKLVEYFESKANEKGEFPRMPVGMNPASWMLDVIGAGLSGALARANANKAKNENEKKAFDYADVYLASDLNAAQLAELQTVAHPTEVVEIKINPADFKISLSSQLFNVFRRTCISYWRDSQVNLGRIITLVVICLIFGIVYLQLNDQSYSGLTSKVSAVFATAGFLAMLSAQVTLPGLIAERAVYYRERAAGCYPSWVYSLSITLIEWVPVFTSSLVGVVIFYFLVGYVADAKLFFQFYLIVSVLVLIESAFGLLSAALFPNFVVAIQISGMINTLFFLFGGLFIRPQIIPSGWKWFYYLNPIPKAIIGIILPQFECHLPNPYDIHSGCPVLNDPATGQDITIHSYVQQQWDTGYDNAFGRMLGYLVLTYAVFVIGIFLSLRFISHIKR